MRRPDQHPPPFPTFTCLWTVRPQAAYTEAVTRALTMHAPMWRRYHVPPCQSNHKHLAALVVVGKHGFHRRGTTLWHNHAVDAPRSANWRSSDTLNTTAADGRISSSAAAHLPKYDVRQANSAAELRAAAYLRAVCFYTYPEGRSEYAARVSCHAGCEVSI